MPVREFHWNDRAARYVDARTGRFVSRERVRTALDQAIAARQRRIRELAEQLRTRQISVRAWQAEMRSAMKSLHLYSAAAARGGWAQMSQADYGRVGQVMREQYRYLQRFAEQIEAGRPLDGRFLRRVELYAQAGRRTFHLTERRDMERRGYDLERSLLSPADHCAGCVAQAAKGWQPLGQMVPIGQRDCLSNDRCRVAYRNSRTGEIAA